MTDKRKSSSGTRSTTSLRRDTAVTVQVTTREREPVVSRILLLVWAFLLIVAWVLLVVAFTLPDWIEGTEPTDQTALPYVERRVGLFRQCEQFIAANTDVSSGFTAERCFDVGFSHSNIDAWYASSVLFVVGMIFLSVTIVLALVAAIGGLGVIVAVAKLCMSIGSLFFMVASVLFPLGFIYLDDTCPSGSNQGQCGLTCADPQNGMDYFTLCGPYSVGTASFMMFAGLVVFFISAFCAACVRSV
eukprot:m.33145 g.33145  ORF g.33145 m.33145 type:complete len:245 (+) comp10860_c0_seq1:359-1093(+)